ncbi:serine/threonine-protein kinase pim-2-like isoform X2, partial [Clarias magur]
MRRGSEEMDVKPEKTDTCVEATPCMTTKKRERNSVAVPCERPEKKVKKRTEKEETNVKTEKRADFFSRYILGRLLGKGGCGAVHAGVRKSDGKKVAVKFMRKPGNDTYITLPGDTRRLPLEVALMKLVCEPPHCPLVIELVEWHETSTHVILVLERPEPCTDLFDYCENNTMSESVARIITRQVIHAACHCSDRDVFHRDIKEENILLNPLTLEIKLIDFGCGDLLKDTPYTEYAGTKAFRPPKWIVKREYEAEPATVWGFGVFLYHLVCGEELFCEDKDIVNGHVDFPDHLSE